MTHVLDFDPELAFVNTKSRLSELVATGDQAGTVNPGLSLALAYIYTILKYDTKTIVEPIVYDTLADLFPTMVERSNSTDNKAMVVTRLDTSQSPVYREGALLMPAYVSEASTIVYNIHLKNAEEVEYSNQFVAAALNFYNCAIRKPNSGTKRVIWKDPINQSTRLQSATYDRMFSLWLADKYLRTYTSQYPILNDPLRTLGMAYRLIEIVEEGTKKAVEQLVVSRQFTLELLDRVLLPDKLEESNLELVSGSLDVNASKRDLFSVLYYLKSHKPEGLKLLVLTGFKSGYAFVRDLAALYPLMKIAVYEKSAPTAPKGLKNVTVAGKQLLASNVKTVDELATIYSNLSTTNSNNALMSAWKGDFVSLAGTSTYKPTETYLALYTRGVESVGYSVYLRTRESATEDTKTLRERVKKYARQLEGEYRDTKKWKYEGVSYDQAALDAVSK
ncbi:Hypothetical protein POVR2_LOCUS344 [uncultured virus]|nr:Hypothetical protein POVR2_LOCUS344 [uncultured virus]